LTHVYGCCGCCLRLRFCAVHVRFCCCLRLPVVCWLRLLHLPLRLHCYRLRLRFAFIVVRLLPVTHALPVVCTRFVRCYVTRSRFYVTFTRLFAFTVIGYHCHLRFAVVFVLHVVGLRWLLVTVYILLHGRGSTPLPTFDLRLRFVTFGCIVYGYFYPRLRDVVVVTFPGLRCYVAHPRSHCRYAHGCAFTFTVARCRYVDVRFTLPRADYLVVPLRLRLICVARFFSVRFVTHVWFYPIGCVVALRSHGLLVTRLRLLRTLFTVTALRCCPFTHVFTLRCYVGYVVTLRLDYTFTAVHVHPTIFPPFVYVATFGCSLAHTFTVAPRFCVVPALFVPRCTRYVYHVLRLFLVDAFGWFYVHVHTVVGYYRLFARLRSVRFTRCHVCCLPHLRFAWLTFTRTVLRLRYYS